MKIFKELALSYLSNLIFYISSTYILSSIRNELRSRIQDSTMFIYTSIFSEEHALSSTLFPSQLLLILQDTDSYLLFEVFLP